MCKRLFLLLLLLAGPMALAQPRQLTVRDFLKLSQADTANYLVKGVVTKVRSSTSGSFYLQDETGTLLVYGLHDAKDSRLHFAQLDVVKGDTLTVLGRFTIYNGSTKEMKDGRLIAKADGPDHHLSFYDRLDQRPIFQGKEGKEGLEAFQRWVQAHLKTPSGGEKGAVKVRFVVGRTGSVQEVQVERGASPALNAEAVRVVKSSPKWKPAKSDGTAVRMTYTITVLFE